MRYPKDHKQRTRARLIEAGGRVFRRRGVDGAGVDALAAEAGLTSGAFYGHFAGKEELLTEVIRRAVADNEDARERGLESLEGNAWVGAMLRRYLSREHWEAVEQGCPIPALVSELPRAGEAPREAFAKGVEELLTRIEAHLGDAPRPREQALAGLALAVGGMALARAVGEGRLSREVLEACWTLCESSKAENEQSST